MKWSYRRYKLWVINTNTEAFLYKWDNWKSLMPSIDNLLKLTDEKAYIKTSQRFESENSWLGFGRMIWNEENNQKWTTKYRTPENESKLNFYGTEIWAPDWNESIKSGMPPDVYVNLYNNSGPQSIKEGLVIAIPRQLALKYREKIETELERLTQLIPNSSLTVTTRRWFPGWRFVNNIGDMNPHELDKIVNDIKGKWSAYIV